MTGQQQHRDTSRDRTVTHAQTERDPLAAGASPALYWPPRPCQRHGCESFGIAYLEPAGVWCPRHVPALWRDPRPYASPWATPRCATCGQPGRLPTARFGSDAKCRAHAPAPMRPFLAAAPNRKEIAA